MFTLNLLSCSVCYLARANSSQTRKLFTSCLSTGIVSSNRNCLSLQRQHTCPINCDLRFFATSVLKSSNSFSTKAHSSPDKNKYNTIDQKTHVEDLLFGVASNLSQFAKFKLMIKRYWYILIPVHVVTSIGWIVGFYYISKSGVDIPSMLKYIHLSGAIIEKVKRSDMAHYAVAYLCYNLITVLRYAVSLGLTTVLIKRLVLAGYIKPKPMKKEFMYEPKKAADRVKHKVVEDKKP